MLTCRFTRYATFTYETTSAKLVLKGPASKGVASLIHMTRRYYLCTDGGYGRQVVWPRRGWHGVWLGRGGGRGREEE